MHAKSEGGEMPNLFVIGAMKCGTSSLHQYLDLHPEISMSSLKEPRYFLRHLEDYLLPLISDRQEYLDLFEAGTPYRGETSPGYSKRIENPGVPEAIAREVDDPRFIYLVNDPVQRIPSVVQQRLAARAPALREIYDSIEGEIDSRTLTGIVGDVGDPANPWLESGLYMTQLDAYLEIFPSESILVVDSHDLRERRRGAMERIFEFLGLKPAFDARVLGRELNPGEGKIRDSDLYLKVIRTPVAERVKTVIPRRLRGPLINEIRRLTGQVVPKPTLEDDLRLELEDLYRPEVERLRAFTGQGFSTWSI
jgi:hypothetical protein